ncbi:hypothetical protein Btru_077973 [Bulinus truncatus]|nr:hypothetical protein Btru_077973 [Bulinus truncatus]
MNTIIGYSYVTSSFRYQNTVEAVSVNMTDQLPVDGVTTVQLNVTADAHGATLDQDLISDTAASVLYFLIPLLIVPVTLLTGIVSNVLNLLTYHQLGLDAASIPFFSLSLSDLLYLLIHFASLVGNVAMSVKEMAGGEQVSAASIRSLNVYFSIVMIWYASWPYDISVLTVVFISLQRCLCIALPFHFKTMFTKMKTALFIVVIYVYVTSSYVPIFTTYSLTTITDPYKNKSSLVLHYDNDGKAKEDIFYWMNRILLQMVAQVFIFFNLLVLSVCLARSSRFRRGVVVVSGGRRKQDSPPSDVQKCISSQPNGGIDDQTPGPTTKIIGKKSRHSAIDNSRKLSGKDLQVVKSVTFVAFLFLLTNLPANVLFCVNRFVPGFNIGGKYTKTFGLAYNLRTEIEILNASVNIFVYYHFNTKFKIVLRKCLSRCAGRKFEFAFVLILLITVIDLIRTMSSLMTFIDIGLLVRELEHITKQRVFSAVEWAQESSLNKYSHPTSCHISQVRICGGGKGGGCKGAMIYNRGGKYSLLKTCAIVQETDGL